MHKIFFTVGPSKLYPSVPVHIARALEEGIPSISHRSDRFREIYREAASGLRELLNIPAGHEIFFVGSATEAMERFIQNCVEKESFNFLDGAFGEKFWKTSVAYKKKTSAIETQGKSDIAALVPVSAEAVCLVQNETSEGIEVPLDLVYAIRERHPEKLIAVDIVSSVPYVALDYGRVDCVIFSVQKGIGLPAGLGVMIVGPRALEKAKTMEKNGGDVGWYHSFSELTKYAVKNETPETPNVLDIYLLGAVIHDMKTAGIEKIRALTSARAEKLYQFLNEHPRLSPAVADPKFRSHTTIEVAVDGDATEAVNGLKAKSIVVGAGYGTHKGKHFRIANFPAHSDEDFETLFAALS